MIYAKMGLRNFWRQKSRNIYTLIAVAVGCASLVCLGGYTNRWENTLKNDAIYLRGTGSVIIYKKGGLLQSRSLPKKFTLSASEQKIIREELGHDPAVEELSPFLRMTGLASNGCSSEPFEVIGYDPQLDQKFRAKPEVQRWCKDLLVYRRGEAFAKHETPQVVGLAVGLASLLGKANVLSDKVDIEPLTDLKAYCQGPDAKDRIAADPNIQLMGLTFDGHFGAVDADVAHIFSTGTTIDEDTRLTAPLSLVQDLYQTDRATYLAVYLKDHSRARELAPEFNERLKKLGLELDIYPWDEKRISPFYVGIMSFIKAMGVFCGLLIASIVALCVINLTMMNVLERSKEMGMLKALGFQRWPIVQIFLAEAAVIAFLGCLIGIGVAEALCQVINSTDIRFNPPGFAGSVGFLLVPNPSNIVQVSTAISLLVLIASGTTSFVMAKRSCLELLTQNKG